MPTTDATLEARVVARLDAEKLELDQRVADLTAIRDAAILRLDTAAESCSTTAFAVRDRITSGKAVTDTQATKALDAASEVRNALKALVADAAAVETATAARKKLDTKAEVSRRVKQAKEYNPQTDEPISQRAAVELVLMRAGRPLHYREITRIALETGLLRTEGETPEATVSAMLATRSKAGDTFVKVEPGIFDLLPVESAEVTA